MLLSGALARRPIVILLLIASLTAALVWYSYGLQLAVKRPLLKSLSFVSSENPNLLIPKTREIKLPIASTEDSMLQTYIRLISAERDQRAALKAVITIMANLRTVKMLKSSLKKLYAHFNSRFEYPVIIFHEADFQPHLAAVRAIGYNHRLNMSSIFFQQVNLSVPSSYLKAFGQPPKVSCGGGSSISYRSMCRFHAKMIYEEPMMKHFDYQWRLDDDSILDGEISFDVFAALHNAGCSYGYFQTIIDVCANDVFDVTINYMKMRSIKPTFFHRLKRNEVFFNNFEVSSLKIWRSRQYRDFVEYVDSLGGIYKHRWGDAPIKTLALSMFLPVAEIFQFTNVSYKHHSLSSPLTTKFLVN